jgi:MinD superfamily P-loop ATPase
MKLAVASGKGGTGKTTVAVSLALAAARSRQERVWLLDCDVENPDAALFVKPELRRSREAGILVPVVDSVRCAGCGLCAEICAFHAITFAGQEVVVFGELCHGCGSCAANCPAGAIEERFEATGSLEAGRAGGVEFGMGTLHVGQAMATPVIRQLKAWMLRDVPADDLVILDAPPGCACPVIETVREVDYVLLVTEPTPFGLHDLGRTVAVVRGALGLAVGVVINRVGVGDAAIEDYCARERIPILLRIPFERRIAAASAEGTALIAACPDYRPAFAALLDQVGRVAVETRS